MVKSHVINYWEQKLRSNAAPLLSLNYFNPEFMSLVKPHPLILTAGSSPYEVTKSRVQALFLSGRYRTEQLCSHWSSNTEGLCLLTSCLGLGIKEDLELILISCRSLAGTRERLVNFTIKYSKSVPLLSPIMLDSPNQTILSSVNSYLIALLSLK